MKRTQILAVILALALMVTLAACQSASPNASTPAGNNTQTPGGSTETPTTSAPPDDSTPMELTVFQWEVGNQILDFENLWYYKKLEEQTNVKVKWEPVKEADWSTRLNQMFISGVYPDVIVRGEVDTETYGVSQGILAPLSDYNMAANMPNYYPRLSMNKSGESLISSDGKVYRIGYLSAQNVNHDANHYINKKWLDNLNLEIPKTIDELKTVLLAFRDQDANGNGNTKDEIPFSAGGADGGLIHQTQGIYPHFASFGVPLQRWVYACIQPDDTVVFPGFMSGFREALEFLNFCYTENLLDPEAFEQAEGGVNDKVNADRVGYTTYLRTKNTAWSADVIGDWVSILPPKADGFEVSVPRILEIPQPAGTVIPKTNPDIERTLRWLDAQFEMDMMMTAANGPLELDDDALLNEVCKDGAPLKKNAEGKYEVAYVPESDGLYKIVPVICGQFFSPGEIYSSTYVMPPHRQERYETSKQYEDAGVLEVKSYDYLRSLSQVTAEETEERARLFSDIETFMKDRLTDMITKGVTDAKWESFQSEAKVVGVERYVEIFQKGYNDYLQGK